MINNKMHMKWVILGLIAVILASCTPSETVDLGLASTYAAETLAAIPTLTEMPIPTETETPTPTQTFTPTTEPTLGPVGPVDFPENVNPLTGMEVADPSILDRRPVLVKVANYPASGRPHAGLSLADMVFEYYTGGGGNRFIGLFYGQNAPKIGPVRSGRLVDPQLVSLYEGILGMEGAYVTIFDRIRDILGNRVISGRATCPAICDDGRNTVISVFGDSEALTDVSSQRGVSNRRYTLEGMAFDPQTPEGGQAGDQIKIIFSNLNRGEWRFDEDSGLYLRWIEDTTGQTLEMIPLIDRETDEQLAFSNVVVIFARYTEFTPIMHDIDIWANTTGQRAVIFRDGQAYDLTWTTPRNNQPIQFIDQEGEVFPLKHGNTWIVIMGLNTGASIEEGIWSFNFYLP